jgi:hypothetical protein
MKKLFSIKRFVVLLFPLLVLLATSAFAHWPIDPMFTEHPIGNSFGEFENKGGYDFCMHTGIDILGTPKFQFDDDCSCYKEDPTAPYVRVAVSGKVSKIDIDEADPYDQYNGLTIIGDDGVTYRYWHLEHDSFDSNFIVSHNNGNPVTVGDHIAKLVRWGCDFHHLHYELESNGTYLNPFAGMAPHQDTAPPQIADVLFAEGNRNTGYDSTWKELPKDPQRACTVVSGKVDIIVQYRDRDDAGSTLRGASTLGVYNLLWRACPDSNPDCPWVNTRAFDDMPTAWGPNGNDRATATTTFYSVNFPWISNPDPSHCNADWLYAIVTNFDLNGNPDKSASWDTTKVSNGSYTVSVKAIDFAGNKTCYSKKACVQNAQTPPDVLSPPSDLRIMDSN